ncbi:MAG: type II toxin-antitoxin system VapC family toxin [Achromobacter sp.]|uniref:Ribonuclease VapC n=1 Tax=Achromobacter insuavis TaxID=1287735 RepID=A0A6J5AAZ5_9BURK|nr:MULTISPECIES: type II toxin-antitoxin system VapC family toxin [Achromobacter]MBN9639607.1 type II toxin-antitoxin system VapC family toxin [Achromobacter sp.]MCG2598239.1 type II toxin-antitoxin system VapC family toxin [Achromobacter sp.]MCG2602360.1 type II toxin-antitoxin system VapC family toxin [Achromobacter sp.]CAB3658477.1 Ribonuclease VapC2 [Achromobacter insuavis]CUJ48344.1 tRNA(fMet)-specific endonuclease VapC [Achromobacter sp. 2789STDY5608621]
MSGYLLDTNIISALLRDPNGPAARHIERVGPKRIFTSIVVAAELRYGCAKKGSAKLQAKVESLLSALPVLPLDVPVDIKYGSLRAELEAAGEPIGANDLWIGAHACTLGLTLVTGNTREFERIPGLAVENWLA